MVDIDVSGLARAALKPSLLGLFCDLVADPSAHGSACRRPYGTAYEGSDRSANRASRSSSDHFRRLVRSTVPGHLWTSHIQLLGGVCNAVLRPDHDRPGRS